MRRRTSVTIALLALSLATLAAVPGASAKPPSPAGSPSDHHRPKDGDRSLVGTWVLDTNAADPDNALDLLTISADGTVRDTNCCGGSGAGTWVSIDRETAIATILFPSTDEDGFIGFDTVRGSVELAPDAIVIHGYLHHRAGDTRSRIARPARSRDRDRNACADRAHGAGRGSGPDRGGIRRVTQPGALGVACRLALRAGQVRRRCCITLGSGAVVSFPRECLRPATADTALAACLVRLVRLADEVRELRETIVSEQLSQLRDRTPRSAGSFVSSTCGPLGATRSRTIQVACRDPTTPAGRTSTHLTRCDRVHG